MVAGQAATIVPRQRQQQSQQARDPDAGPLLQVLIVRIVQQAAGALLQAAGVSKVGLMSDPAELGYGQDGDSG